MRNSTRRTFTLVFLILTLALFPLSALADSHTASMEGMADHMKSDHADEEPHHAAGAMQTSALDVSPPTSNDLTIQVNGIVCSFCAHGLEKALSKLDGLDASRHGNGVLVAIESQLVTLAFAEPTDFDFAEIHKRIVKAGYDPVRFEFQLAGVLTADGEEWSVTRAGTQTAYRVSADTTEQSFQAGQALNTRVSVAAERVKDAQVGSAIRVELNAGR